MHNTNNNALIVIKNYPNEIICHYETSNFQVKLSINGASCLLHCYKDSIQEF